MTDPTDTTDTTDTPDQHTLQVQVPLKAPPVEVYHQSQPFQYSVTQKEDDFARVIASGVLATEALLLAAVITRDEAATLGDASLWSLANNLKKSRGVQERINHYYALHQLDMDVTISRVNQELACMAFADFALLYDEDGSPIRNPRQIPRHLRSSIKEWGFDRDGNMRFKMHDKNKAIDMIATLGGYLNESKEAAAPKVTINLGGGESYHPPTIDVTPTRPVEEDILS